MQKRGIFLTNPLAVPADFSPSWRVSFRNDLVLPEQPVQMTPAQIGELCQQFTRLRLDISDYIALVATLVKQYCRTAAPAAAPTPRPSLDGGLVPSGVPVTLNREQVKGLYECLSTVRHDINGQGAVVVAVLELMRLKPQDAERLVAKLVQMPDEIQRKLEQFSAVFTSTLAIQSLPAPPPPAGVQGGTNAFAGGASAATDGPLAALLLERPSQIRECIQKFSAGFEAAIGIKRATAASPPQTAVRVC